MKKTLNLLTFLSILFSSLALLAKEETLGSDFPLPAKAKIRILGYDDQTQTFRVESVRFPGEGESYVLKKDLLSRIKNINKIKGMDKVRAYGRPGLLVREEIILTKKLPTYHLEEIERRKKRRKPASTKRKKKIKKRRRKK